MPPRSTNPQPDPDVLRTIRARNRLIDHIRASLKGAGLDIRERTSALVISNPGYPDNGRVYIPYASADVSLRRPVWHYLGRFHGHQRDDHPDADPIVDAATIITVLTSPSDTPAAAVEFGLPDVGIPAD
jgi:hypothetical protein